jgi:hypothetical protein
MARDPSDRSYERITRADLKRLARIAREEREDFFGRHPEWALLYRRRMLGSALCQEAALHFINGTSGLREFDVWSFYAEHAEAPFPHHIVSHRDLGKSKFGRALDAEGYRGRRVDLSGRSLPCEASADPVEALQQYLRRGETPSARSLRQSAVILIEPEHYTGYVVWPTLIVSTRDADRSG